MQALTGLFARQFGTPNYAAHGGFCSVNMAAGMIYTFGGSFWEFGGPDLDRAKLFVMIGTAEDHHSNPLKIAISKFKRDGGRFVSINPDPHRLLGHRRRVGADPPRHRWRAPARALPRADRARPLRPRVSRPLHQCRSARPHRSRCRRRRDAGARPCASVQSRSRTRARARCDVVGPPYATGPWHRTPTAPTRSCTARSLCPTAARSSRRCSSCASVSRRAHRSGQRRSPVCPQTTIRRLAREMGVTARDQRIELPIAWTDSWGHEHSTVTGNPVAFHAMRGLAAHSNGFQTVRALAILMSLLGTIDRPGGFRHRAPFPRMVPPSAKPPSRPEAVQPDTPFAGLALGWPGAPDDLFVNPRRHAGAHRQGVLVGASARRARDDAQRHHQRVARGPVPDRHAHVLHGEHGVELGDAHRQKHAGCSPTAAPTASTRSRSSSSATRSSRRRRRSPISCCRTRRISSGTT